MKCFFPKLHLFGVFFDVHCASLGRFVTEMQLWMDICLKKLSVKKLFPRRHFDGVWPQLGFTNIISYESFYTI